MPGQTTNTAHEATFFVECTRGGTLVAHAERKVEGRSIFHLTKIYREWPPQSDIDLLARIGGIEPRDVWAALVTAAMHRGSVTNGYVSSNSD